MLVVSYVFLDVFYGADDSFPAIEALPGVGGYGWFNDSDGGRTILVGHSSPHRVLAGSRRTRIHATGRLDFTGRTPTPAPRNRPRKKTRLTTDKPFHSLASLVDHPEPTGHEDAVPIAHLDLLPTTRASARFHPLPSTFGSVAPHEQVNSRP